MPPTTLTHTTVEVPGRGYQKRAVVHDAQTGRPICQRIDGIPYAVPLDASQRWKRARPLPADFRYGAFADSPADFSGLANECPQPAVSGHDMPRQNEDCLQMNVFVPEGQRPREGWPVVFYICMLCILVAGSTTLVRLAAFRLNFELFSTLRRL